MATQKDTAAPALGWVKTSVVVELAGPRAYARGALYQHDGRVELRASKRGRVRAVVRGTMPYQVELWENHAKPAWSCSCPVGKDGGFCKHCVAVALTVGASPLFAPRSSARRDDDADNLRDYLGGLDADELVDLVLEQTGEDWRLRERLTAKAATQAGQSVDVATWRKRVDAAFRTGDFVSYAAAPGWEQGVEEVLGGLDELIEAGHADAVVQLAERAHQRAERAMGHIDDSDGCLTRISAHIAELHLQACEAARPDPVELAGRLVDLELTSELDTFHRAAARYADVLGTKGVPEYRRLIEPKWRALGPRGDGWSTERFRVTQAMIGVALATGDPDVLISVKRKDLRIPDDYLEVAEALAAAGRVDEAVEWARKGLAAFPDRFWQTPPLREFLAGLLRERGDGDGALELFWLAFEEAPTLQSYRRLLQEAELDDGVEQWKQRALTALRFRVVERRPDDDERHRSLVQRNPTSSLVEILLFEGQADAAWEVASEYGCDGQLWLTLARVREKEHPLDAIPIYEREAYAQIETKKNQGYRSAVDSLSRIRRLAAEAGSPQLFDELLASLRTTHKPKRNLMALLDQKGW